VGVAGRMAACCGGRRQSRQVARPEPVGGLGKVSGLGAEGARQHRGAVPARRKTGGRPPGRSVDRSVEQRCPHSRTPWPGAARITGRPWRSARRRPDVPPPQDLPTDSPSVYRSPPHYRTALTRWPTGRCRSDRGVVPAEPDPWLRQGLGGQAGVRAAGPLLPGPDRPVGPGPRDRSAGRDRSPRSRTGRRPPPGVVRVGRVDLSPATRPKAATGPQGHIPTGPGRRSACPVRPRRGRPRSRWDLLHRARRGEARGGPSGLRCGPFPVRETASGLRSDPSGTSSGTLPGRFPGTRS
jgi:hypothetical protein